MTTINIHKDKLLPAAFAYQQRKLKEIMEEQVGMVEREQKSLFGFRGKFKAIQYLERNSDSWFMLGLEAKEVMSEYVKLQTACRVAEDGIVSLDIDVVQRIFGEEL